MKTYIQTAIAMILPFISFAQDKGIDQIIDEKFGNATGWFVDFIFYKIDILFNLYRSKEHQIQKEEVFLYPLLVVVLI